MVSGGGWRPMAEATREALALLGYDVPACLPGEPQACGGSDAGHAAANLGALRAVVEHRITHLGPGARPLVDAVADRVTAELTAGPACDQGHDEGER